MCYLHSEWGLQASEVLAAEASWEDIEIEVALHSGSVLHIVSESDTPRCLLDSSASARPCDEFIVGDGGTMKNLGQKALNLSSDCASFSFVFQIAAVHRPLLSKKRQSMIYRGDIKNHSFCCVSIGVTSKTISFAMFLSG